MTNSWAFLVGGGALTLAGSTVGSWIQARAQRKSVHDDRVWERRAEVYVELLGLADIARTDARARAFASPKVRNLCAKVVEAQDAVLKDARTIDPEGEALPVNLIERISTARALGDQLETQVRWELRIRDTGDGGPLRRAWTWVCAKASHVRPR